MVAVVPAMGFVRSLWLPRSCKTTIRGCGQGLSILTIVGEPVIILPHSMGGPITWKLVELEPALVAGVIVIAPGYPGEQ